MKGQGSSKTVRHCSAHLKTGRVTVNYTYTHKTQLGHLRIPQATRRVIASKLRSGITAQRIIDDIRDSETNHISREHLVSKKDISNIKKQYNIRRHPNDLISVVAIVNEMEGFLLQPSSFI